MMHDLTSMMQMSHCDLRIKKSYSCAWLYTVKISCLHEAGQSQWPSLMGYVLVVATM